MGAEIVDVSLPLYEYAQPISNAILSSEATAAHRDLVLRDGDKLYPQVRDRLEEGLFITAAEYLRAQQARQVFCAQVNGLLQQVDLLAGPVEPVTAPVLLERRIDVGGESLPAVPLLDQVHPACTTSRVLPRFPSPVGSPRTACRLAYT